MIEQIREFYWAKPFTPFAIHLADGRWLSVTHPESMALGPNGRTVAVYQPASACHMINVSLVTDVVLNPEAAASKS